MSSIAEAHWAQAAIMAVAAAVVVVMRISDALLETAQLI
jgi:hypothetical protein